MALDRTPPFRRLLVANRGEIAVRVIRACDELGIDSVAVYSDADRGALHTRLATEAHRIGPGPAAESYLHGDRIVEVALDTGAEAIHPGYGFLAESAAFAELCTEAGLAWIGPPASAMRLAGDKAAARHLAAEAGVPIVPGYDGADQADATLIAEAERIGYPLLVKAAGGGGGRGMRTATDAVAISEALASARREALAAFGDGALILERLIEHARHVEVQILGDHHGTLLQLGDRDCSVQRRHQKVIEESPAPGLAPDLRRAIADAALTVARAAGYWNAGTCEFLVEPSGAFWFIEMNARLQVEHPVTELVMGVDLVRHQIEIAAGRPLSLRQEDLVPRGHAVECRLYAEDPDCEFIPSTGRIARIRPPIGPGLRHDLGYADGDVMPADYDTMLGKLIAFAEDRPAAITRARAALDRLVVEGVATNRDLLTWILDEPSFRAGTATTDLLATRWHVEPPQPATPSMLAAAAAAALAASAGGSAYWSIGGQGVILFLVGADADPTLPTAVHTDRDGPGAWRVTVSDATFRAIVEDDRVTLQTADDNEPALSCLVIHEAEAMTVRIGEQRARVRIAGPPSADAAAAASTPGDRGAGIVSPMPGRIVRVDVAVGDSVAEHQPLLVLEAMKIEHVVAAPRAGIVAAVYCALGESVSGGQHLIELNPL